MNINTNGLNPFANAGSFGQLRPQNEQTKKDIEERNSQNAQEAEQTEQSKETNPLDTLRRNRANALRGLQEQFASKLTNAIAGFLSQNQSGFVAPKTLNQIAQKPQAQKEEEKKDELEAQKIGLPALDSIKNDKPLSKFGSGELFSYSKNEDLDAKSATELVEKYTKNGEISSIAASSLAANSAINYSVSFDEKTGQYTQTFSYNYTFAGSTNVNITDKDGNSIDVSSSVFVGRSLEISITGGAETLGANLGEFLRDTTFALDFGGSLDEIKDFVNDGFNTFIELSSSAKESIGELAAKSALENAANGFENAENGGGILAGAQNAVNKTRANMLESLFSSGNPFDIFALMPSSMIESLMGAKDSSNNSNSQNNANSAFNFSPLENAKLFQNGMQIEVFSRISSENYNLVRLDNNGAFFAQANYTQAEFGFNLSI